MKGQGFYELPVYRLISTIGLGEFVLSNKFEGVSRIKEYMNSEHEFILSHLKGGHSPFEYANKGIDLSAYKAELVALAEKLEPVIQEAKKHFDRIVIVADHGRTWPELDGKRSMYDPKYGPTSSLGHGGNFHISNLHVPVWVYPDEKVDDSLYDLRVAYQFLMGEKLTSRQMVFSTSPGYYDYNRMAITYLNDGKLVSDNYQTKEPYDV